MRRRLEAMLVVLDRVDFSVHAGSVNTIIRNVGEIDVALAVHGGAFCELVTFSYQLPAAGWISDLHGVLPVAGGAAL